MPFYETARLPLCFPSRPRLGLRRVRRTFPRPGGRAHPCGEPERRVVAHAISRVGTLIHFLLSFFSQPAPIFHVYSDLDRLCFFLSLRGVRPPRGR